MTGVRVTPTCYARDCEEAAVWRVHGEWTQEGERIRMAASLCEADYPVVHARMKAQPGYVIVSRRPNLAPVGSPGYSWA